MEGVPVVTAMVAPSAIRGIDSWRRQAAMDALLDQIRALPGNAALRILGDSRGTHPASAPREAAEQRDCRPPARPDH